MRTSDLTFLSFYAKIITHLLGGITMSKFNDVDLTRGYQKYDAMVKNIEGIFNKINQRVLE